QIIKSHGGEIYLENLEKGARFTFKLPVATQETKAAEAVEEVQVPSGARGRVLIVDDESVILSFCEEVLGDSGFAVQTCNCGADAIKALEGSGSFEAVVIDHKMPGGLSGTDIYDWVVKNLPGMESRVIFMTGASVNPSTHQF